MERTFAGPWNCPVNTDTGRWMKPGENLIANDPNENFWNWSFNTFAYAEYIGYVGLQLSDNLFTDIQALQDVVIASTRGYVVGGLTLQKIFRYKLWEALGYKSVKDFCWGVIGRSVHYCRKTIKAAQVAFALIQHGFSTLPTCQSQAEEMIPLLDDEMFSGQAHTMMGNEKLAAAWNQVLDAAENAKAPVTASLIRKIIKPEEDEKVAPSKVSVDPETYKTIEAEARKEGISPAEWLKRLVQQKVSESSTPGVTDPEAEAAWEADLEDLIEEHDSISDDIPIPPNLRVGDRIVTPNGVATVTEIGKSVVWADYGDKVSLPHQLKDIVSIVPRPLDNS